MIFILYWRYLGEPGFEIVRAYFDEKRAKDDLELVSSCNDGREWGLKSIQITDGWKAGEQKNG